MEFTSVTMGCEINAGGNFPAIHLIDDTNNHELICRRCLLRKGPNGSYTITESGSGSTGAICHCQLTAPASINNLINTPYNVIDGDL